MWWIDAIRWTLCCWLMLFWHILLDKSQKLSCNSTVLYEKGKESKIFPFPLLWLLFFTFFRGESSLLSSGELWWASHILFYSTCMGSFGRWKISHTVCEDHFHQWIKYRTNLCKKYCRGRISIWSLFCSSTDHDLLNLDKNAG
jgi:hypothetical protein